MAKGGEKFLTFGNFSKEATFLEGKTKANNNQGDLVFLLDNVSLTANDPAYSSCPEMEETRRLLYATNHRHTYKKGIERNLEPEEVISPPLPPIEEVEDTTITAAPLPTTFEIPGVAFDFDLHRLKPDYLPALDSFAVVIQKMGWNQIQVLGHTDNIGEDDYNLELSARRAEAVKHYLDKKLAGKEVIILAEGKGECCPKANNDTEENRARNRRVEIIPQTE
ncbi:MAG: OmpA family protein [Saprospiraceae bacterium]|nr:OmpA family protein [Saprospiraceae bacterium]